MRNKLLMFFVTLLCLGCAGKQTESEDGQSDTSVQVSDRQVTQETEGPDYNFQPEVALYDFGKKEAGPLKTESKFDRLGNELLRKDTKVDKFFNKLQSNTDRFFDKVEYSTNKLDELSSKLDLDRELNAFIDRLEVRADTTIGKKVRNAVEKVKVEGQKVNDKINHTISDITYKIKMAIWLAALCAILMVVCIFLALFFYFKFKKLSFYKDIIEKFILDAITDNEKIKAGLLALLDEFNAKQTFNGKSLMEKMKNSVMEYLVSDAFKGKVRDIIGNECEKLGIPQVLEAVQVELFAGDSGSEVLADVQEAYQSGKSIYKLVLPYPNCSRAELDLCTEDEVRQGILAASGKCLSPVCEVERMTDKPTKTVVEQKGQAEKIGDTWVVKVPMKVKLL